MRVKIDPEVVRLVVAVTAFIQMFATGLLTVHGIPDWIPGVLIALGAALQAMCAAYTQGIQTEPPHGMITEEYAKKDVTVAADRQALMEDTRDMRPAPVVDSITGEPL